MSIDGVVKALAGAAQRSAPASDHPELSGHFANVIDIGNSMIAVGTDGVGSKHLLAVEPEQFRGIAIDCAAMNANDVICVGATPVALVDYLACESTEGLEPYVAAIAEGFEEAERLGAGGLIGGEVAVLPDVIAPRADGVPALDLAATCIGVVESGVLSGHATRVGDVVLGIRSSGLHSNGFTLMRRLIDREGVELDAPAPWGGDGTAREQLLTPTLLYPHLMAVVAGSDVHAAANITGGGLANLGRVLPTNGARIDAWPELDGVFDWIAARLPIADAWGELNMGIGFVLVVEGERVESVVDVIPPMFETCVLGEVTDSVPPRSVELVSARGALTFA